MLIATVKAVNDAAGSTNPIHFDEGARQLIWSGRLSSGQGEAPPGWMSGGASFGWPGLLWGGASRVYATALSG